MEATKITVFVIFVASVTFHAAVGSPDDRRRSLYFAPMLRTLEPADPRTRGPAP